MFCKYLKQLAKTKKLWYAILAGKIKKIPVVKFTQFLRTNEGQTNQAQQQRFEHINHVARKQMTIYVSQDLKYRKFFSHEVGKGERKQLNI